MKSNINTVEQYLQNLSPERRDVIQSLREVVKANLSPEFQECISYGMIGYCVPHTIYPKGYHCDPSLPLPFFSIASQKNFIGIYHFGIYVKQELYDWFVEEHGKYIKTKIDMGKSCIRFKKIDQIPYQLIGDLCSKMSLTEWLAIYEESLEMRK